MMWWRELLFTAAYVGYFPIAPGTAGTVLAMAIYFFEYRLCGYFSWIVNAIVVILFAWPAMKMGDVGEAYFGKKDPPQVVLDEVLGYWISVLFWPFNWKTALIAFVLFRMFDMIKPPPIRKLEEREGGFGIMIDDYIAGIYTNLTMAIGLFIMQLMGIPVFYL
ncbi:MAG: phosphatidylglycerophosphatase A [Spirochaetes bacterium]|nr:phosphatidylglycerophosphatase A [Spirochaetota bacterium]